MCVSSNSLAWFLPWQAFPRRQSKAAGTCCTVCTGEFRAASAASASPRDPLLPWQQLYHQPPPSAAAVAPSKCVSCLAASNAKLTTFHAFKSPIPPHLCTPSTTGAASLKNSFFRMKQRVARSASLSYDEETRASRATYPYDSTATSAKGSTNCSGNGAANQPTTAGMAALSFKCPVDQSYDVLVL